MTVAPFTAHLEKWNIIPDGSSIETPSSLLMPVKRGAAPAMLKVYKPLSDERHGTDYLKYIAGDGAVRVFDADDDAVLMERAIGSRSLFAMAINGEDLQSAEILADVVERLHAPQINRQIPKTLVPLEHQFASLFTSAGEHSLLKTCAAVARKLLECQSDIIPLHGDLHHSNVLDGGARGWLAIDPKGLIGERAYEVANLLGNPWPHGEIVHNSERMSRLARLYAAQLKLDLDRVFAYALAHAGLAASWDIDDGFDPGYRLKCIEVLKPFVTDRNCSR
jgi:streptomycin 6-kinase